MDATFAERRLATLSTRGAIVLFAGACLLPACRDKKPENLAPAASALASAAPIGDKAVRLQVDTPSSKVSFLMQAPIEKISGDAPASVSGELFVDPQDVTKASGLIKIDLDKLVLYQQKREDDKGEFSERQVNDLQNKHARAWLEIGEDAPADARTANRYAEFRISGVEAPSARDVTALTGAERKLNATIVGDFRLHGRKNQKRAKVELTFRYAGDLLAGVHVRTTEPVLVGLEDYDVRPREGFGKLAQKTLDALGSKVAKTAPIELEFDTRAP